MTGLYQAVRVVAVYLLFSSVLLGILQESPFKNYVRMFCGLMMVLLLMRSFSFFSIDVDVDLDRIMEQSAETDEFSARLLEAEEAGKDSLREKILQELQNKAEKFARENGYELQDFKVEMQENYQIEGIWMKLKERSEQQTETRHEALGEKQQMEADIEDLRKKAGESFSLEPEAVMIEIL